MAETEPIAVDATSTAPDQPSEDFLYVDDNGEVIDPCEEASYLMAMELGSEMVEAPSGDWYTVAAAELADYQQRTAAAAEAEVEAKAAGGEAEAEDEAYEEGVEEGFEEEGPWTRAASTMSADEWVPERIVGERTRGGVKSYKVKWRWYDEMTWEPYEWLFEEGHGPLVEAYLTARAKNCLHNHVHREPLALFSPAKYWLDYVERIQRAFADSNHCVTHIAPCHSHSNLFARHLHPGGVVAPVMLFHGTRKGNMRSIVRNGLKVPGSSGVRVVNGAAHGVGVYTAKNPAYSMYYSVDSDMMFVCMGLISATHCRANTCDVAVFKQSEHVLPAWLVRFESLSMGTQPPETRLCTVLDLLGPVPRGGEVAPAMAPVPVAGPVPTPAPVAPTSQPSTDQEGASIVPRQYRQLTKRLLRQAPRHIKAEYRAGNIAHKPSSK